MAEISVEMKTTATLWKVLCSSFALISVLWNYYNEVAGFNTPPHHTPITTTYVVLRLFIHSEIIVFASDPTKYEIIKSGDNVFAMNT